MHLISYHWIGKIYTSTVIAKKFEACSENFSEITDVPISSFLGITVLETKWERRGGKIELNWATWNSKPIWRPK